MNNRKCHVPSSSLKYFARRKLSILGIALVVPLHTLFSFGPSSDHCFASATISGIGNFLRQGDFEDCKRYLVEADTTDPSGQVNANEYTRFIALWTNGRIDEEEFINLPFDLLTEFQFSTNWGGDSKLYIPTTDATDADEAYLTEVCSGIYYVLNYLLQPTSSPTSSDLTNVPSAMHSSMPSQAPSLYPTKMPSMKPTEIPTAIPSLAPSQSPSQSPSANPTDQLSAAPSSIPSPTPSHSMSPSVSANQVVGNTLAPSSGPTMNARFDIDISYDIKTDGVNEIDIMSGAGNTIASDLVFATRAIANQIMGVRRHMSQNMPKENNRRRNLDADNSNDISVEIKSVVPMDCKRPKNGVTCVIINSVVSVFVDQNENRDNVRQRIVNGMNRSFKDGTFSGYLSMT